jgi:hypothetical protein
VYVSPARSESAGCWVNEVMVAWLEIPPLITYAAPLCSMHMLVLEDVHTAVASVNIEGQLHSNASTTMTQ